MVRLQVLGFETKWTVTVTPTGGKDTTIAESIGQGAAWRAVLDHNAQPVKK